jgi:hypothetical protein
VSWGAGVGGEGRRGKERGRRSRRGGGSATEVLGWRQEETMQEAQEEAEKVAQAAMCLLGLRCVCVFYTNGESFGQLDRQIYDCCSPAW